MNEDTPWTAEQIGQALERAKREVERERRAQFAHFGVSEECAWPSSRVFHEHSSLGPAWCPIFTIEEVGAFTKKLDYKRYPNAKRVQLPKRPRVSLELEHSIRARRSTREFSERPITLEQLATLLELGAGVTEVGDIPRRAAPSGGGLYPVETYVLAFGVEGLSTGIWHYQALDNALEHVRPLTGLTDMSSFLPPGLLAGGPQLVLALSAVFARTQLKYLERGYRFALLEAGHVAQNFSLVATALALGATCIGGYWDDPFNALLGFDPTQEAVIYSVILGHPRAAERPDARG